MAEREWREARDMRSSTISIGLVLGAALMLRLWALDAGLPYAPTAAEAATMDAALTMATTGDLHPRDFGDGALYRHLQVGVVALGFMTGAVEGRWSSLEQVDASDFHLWSRGLTAALGVATVLLVYVIGMRWGARHGLLAAGLMAVMPQHVLASHRIVDDIPATLLVTLTLLLALRANERATRGSFAWAGAVAGLAAAVKYGAALAILMPLVAAWMTLECRPTRLRCAMTSVAAALGGFLLGSPFALLDLPAFLDGFGALAATAGLGSDSTSGWTGALRLLRDGLGWPALVLASTGLVLGIVRAIKGPGRVRWALACAFPLVFLEALSDTRFGSERAILPVLPFACLLAAAAVVSGVSLLRRFDIPRMPRTALIAALTIAALLTPSLQAIGIVRQLGRRPTTGLAYDWIIRSIPPGASILVEADALTLPSRSYDVQRVAHLEPGNHDRGAIDEVDYVVLVSVTHKAAAGASGRRVAGAKEVARFEPSADHPGPALRILRLR